MPFNLFGTPAKAADPLTLCVCPLSKLPSIAQQLAARHVVTLIRDHEGIPTPDGIQPEHHLRLSINDIAAPQDGLVHPAEEHVQDLLGFIKAWPGTAPMVIHCWAGISRSTAAAFIAQCQLNPEANVRTLAQRLRAASPTATPNPLMVALADDILGRQGKMVDSIAEIGLGTTAMEGRPFMLPARIA